MALSAAIVWEVRTAGSDNSGGGFKAGASGTDRSQQDAAFASGANLTVHASTNTDVLPDGYTAVAADVGNVIQITGGAGFTAGFYEILSIQGSYWRLDRSPAAVGTSGGAWAMGGALASPGKAAGAKVAGNDVWIKTGQYDITTATQNVSGGVVNDTTGGVDKTNMSIWRGYETTRGDTPTTNRPVLKVGAGVGTLNIFRMSGSVMRVSYLVLDGNSQTSVCGLFSTQVSIDADHIKVVGCTNNGIDIQVSYGVVITDCEVTGCSTAAKYGIMVAAVSVVNCSVHDNSCGGINAAYGSLIGCLCYRNSGTNGGINANQAAAYNCVSYSNAGFGFQGAYGGTNGVLIDCIAYGNTGYGFTSDADNQKWSLLNCAGGSNTSGNYPSGWFAGPNKVGFVALTANPFANVSTSVNGAADFSLNTTAGGGAACRAAGYAALSPDGLTQSYWDIGASQHQDAGGGGGVGPSPRLVSGGSMARILGG